VISITTLKEIYCEKLSRTNSHDAAFTKACWVAYKQGLADALTKAEAWNFPGGVPQPNAPLLPPGRTAPERKANP
jgi:hypothetical protein